MVSPDLTEDKVTLLTDYGIDLDNRRIYLFDEINPDTAYYVILGLHIMQESNDEKEVEPIELHIASPGGDLGCAFQIYDAIQLCPCPVRTYGWGEVASAALLVLSCGTHRYATEHCWSMAHFASHSMIDADEQLSVLRTKLLINWADKYYGLLAKHTKKRASVWKDAIRLSREHWLDSSKMLEWGVVDEILGSNNGNKNKVRKSKRAHVPKVYRTKNTRRVRTRRRSRRVANHGN